jgi:subtilisin-like proprotein convertase family protein/V8-like Glu-specific endopeptidase
MKISTLPLLGSLLLAGNLTVAAKPKTANPVKVPKYLTGETPYRYNGVVLTEVARGSGFCAWNQKTFFSAAHVVFDEGAWGAPPFWVPKQNAENVDVTRGFLSRGYYRWIEYGEIAAAPGSDAFRKDVILGYAFRNLINNKPAKINLDGGQDLKKKTKSLITGYPAENAYLEEDIEGYFLHKTGPEITPYKKYSGKALISTLVTTGPGNSGGPVWTKDKKKNWVASGVLVGGLPSESVVYGFSSDINSLTRAVAPVIKSKKGRPIAADGVTASSLFFPHNEEIRLPDGATKWTSVRFGVSKFDTGALVTKVSLSFDIRTAHRGDLQVLLEGPSGYQAVIHNEGGANKENLIANDIDLTEAFSDIEANGYWYLRVRDRLKGDVSVLKSAVLEISTDDGETTTP